MKFRQLLELPFHHFQAKQEKWLYVISCSVFFMIFALVYQPFGLSAEIESGEHTFVQLFALIGFISTVVFIVLCVSQFVLRERFPNTKNDLRYFLKWFLIDIALVVFLSLIVEITFDNDELNSVEAILDELVFDVVMTYFALVFVLLYPVLGTCMYVYLKQLHNDKQQLKTDLDVVTTHYKMVSGNEELIKILDEKGECKLTIPLNNLYAIESKNQYVSIKYKRNDILMEQCIRTRFSKLLDELQDIPGIYKCHRSFAINLFNVLELKTINQKPNVILDEAEALRIPVSKTYLKDVKAQLSKY
ncbi:LytTR family transcriptional regulator DNA-binding domain-containing protein [Winogradskyella sp. 3972H.M.0a.05]|uniref:LytTR family DNA-binding domain-containing protein n=1 Tax=Winogradskyella sp. 3972H.M.0a.05 TaxID=2950277 RepID=UPI00339260A1